MSACHSSSPTEVGSKLPVFDGGFASVDVSNAEKKLAKAGEGVISDITLVGNRLPVTGCVRWLFGFSFLGCETGRLVEGSNAKAASRAFALRGPFLMPLSLRGPRFGSMSLANVISISIHQSQLVCRYVPLPKVWQCRPLLSL
jgi:hypothetical protein